MNGVAAASLVGLAPTAVGTGTGGNSANTNSSGEILGDSGGSAGELVGNQGGVLASHLGGQSDDDDDEMPSSPDTYDEDEVSFIGPDDVTAQLAAAGGWTGETKTPASSQVEEWTRTRRQLFKGGGGGGAGLLVKIR